MLWPLYIHIQVASALSLVLYHTLVIDSADMDWIYQIIQFMDKFYRYGMRSAVPESVVCDSGLRPGLWSGELPWATWSRSWLTTGSHRKNHS